MKDLSSTAGHLLPGMRSWIRWMIDNQIRGCDSDKTNCAQITPFRRSIQMAVVRLPANIVISVCTS